MTHNGIALELPTSFLGENTVFEVLNVVRLLSRKEVPRLLVATANAIRNKAELAQSERMSPYSHLFEKLWHFIGKPPWQINASS